MDMPYTMSWYEYNVEGAIVDMMREKRDHKEDREKLGLVTYC
jgi:hypothetical protein